MERNPRQQITSQIFNPIPRVTIPLKLYVPDRIINPSLIQELFLKISEGDLFKLKDFLLMNNVNLSVKDDNGNSVLHSAIKNKNFTKNEKIELINFLIDRGAPIMAFNNENVTPLHLAARYQMEDIIDLLLSKGADPNTIDNQFMTPLYYATQGTNTDCKSIRKIKIDSIIDDEFKEKPNERILQINSALLDFMYYDDNVNKYLKHMKNTLLSYDIIFSEELDSIKQNINKNIVEILYKSGISDEEKTDAINNNIYGAQKSISSNLSAKLKNTLGNISIQSGNRGGPSNNLENKVLPYLNIKDGRFIPYKTNIDNKYDGLIASIKDKTQTIRDALNEIIIRVKKNNITLENIYWFNAGYSVNTPNAINRRDEINEIIKIDDVKMKRIKEIVIDNPVMQLDLTQNNNITWENNIDLLKINKNTQNFAIERGTLDEIKKNTAKLYNKVPITNDIDINAQTMRNIVRTGPNPTNLGENINFNLPKYQEYGINIDYTFLSNFKYYLLRIKNYLNVIQQNNDIMENYIKNKYFYHIPIIMSLNVTYIVNVLLFIRMFNNEFKNIKQTHKKLLNMFVGIYDKKQTYSFYINRAIGEITQHNKYYNNSDSESLFNDMLGILNEYNKFIMNINADMLLNYINYYNNKFLNNFNKNTTDEMTNIFTNSLFNIQQYNGNLKSFDDMINGFNRLSRPVDVKEMKKYLIEIFIPQINTLTKSFYSSNIINGPAVYNDGTLVENYYIDNYIIRRADGGIYLLDINITNATDINIPNIIDVQDGFLYQGSKLIINNTVSPNTFNILGLINDFSPKTRDDISNNNGQFGIKSNSVENKVNAAFALINIDPDLHFYIIKYQIIEYIINNAYSLLLNVIPANIPDYIIKFKNILDNYNNYIRSRLTLSSNNFGMILSTIGKLSDNIINSFLRGSIETASIINSNKIIDITSVQPNYSTILQNIINNGNKEILSGEDYGYKLHLNEIINEVINKFMDPNLTNDQNKINQSYELNFTSLLLDEDIVDTNNIVALYNYSLNSQKIIKQCYSINTDIINKLARVTQINKKDFLGNSVLFYAIENQNIDAINTIINNGANVNINQVKNNIGLTPLIFAEKLYKAHVNVLNKSNNFITSLTNPIYDKLRDIIKQNPLYKNNILKYSDVFFPMILVLLNHYLFLQTKRYPKDWTFDKMKQLSNMLTNDEQILINPKLPLLDIQENELQNLGIAGSNVLNDKKKQIEKEKMLLQENINNLLKSNESLNNELNTLNNSIDTIKQNRILEINNILNFNNNMIAQNNVTLNNLENTINNLVNNKTVIETKNITSNIPNIINSSYSNLKNGNVIDIYNSVFWNILNNKTNKKYTIDLDFRTYPALFKNYIDSEKINNIIVIHPFLQKYVQNLLNNKITNDNVNKINLISDVYNNVFFQIAKDYEELPLEYNNNNYVLKESLDIIAYALKHTLLTSFYHSIIKTITKYVKMINSPPSDNNVTSLKYDNIQYSEFINKTVSEIINSGKNNESALMKFIFDFLPSRLIKIATNIYDGENDPDRIYNKDGLYNHVLKIIISNGVAPILENSSLIKNIKDVIIPYFKDYIDLFINEAKSLVDGYYGYILSESKLLKILSLLFSQSIKENN